MEHSEANIVFMHIEDQSEYTNKKEVLDNVEDGETMEIKIKRTKY